VNPTGNATVFADFLVNWHENGKVAEVGDAIMVGYHADCPI
jgi:hypothetical protein